MLKLTVMEVLILSFSYVYYMGEILLVSASLNLVEQLRTWVYKGRVSYWCFMLKLIVMDVLIYSFIYVYFIGVIELVPA